MLQVDIRELARGPVDIAGELAGNDPLFAGLDFVLAGPVQVRGRLQAAGEGRFYWHGRLSAQVTEQCRRCLVPVAVNVAADIGALFTPDPEAKDVQAQEARAPHALQGGDADLAAVPALSRSQAAAPGVSHLRLLRRCAAGGRRGHVT